MKRTARYSAFALIFMGVLFFGARSILYYTLEAEAITTRPNGSATPESYGVPSQQFQFDSGGRTLHASLVRAVKDADNTTPAVLLFHGRRENAFPLG
ncbi:MAG: hypothetical protein U5K69_27485 [Balneolaceae bacterium]|nr:hypothetical protein [Balneolaceae bacterium]